MFRASFVCLPAVDDLVLSALGAVDEYRPVVAHAHGCELTIW